MLIRTQLRRAPKVRAAHPRHAHQNGFVLMDVLISVLLFSFGVLGLIGLQAAMTRAQTEAKVRADASYLAQELIGQIWSDINQIGDYSESGCAHSTPCQEWKDRVSAALPKGEGTVASDATTGDVTITISWTPPSGETHKYVTQTTVTKAGG